MHLVKPVEERHWFRGLVLGALAVVSMAGLAVWVIDRAEAQSTANASTLKSLDAKVEAKDAGMRAELGALRTDLEARQRQTESKVDRVEGKVDEVLQELRRQRR